jgi:queuine tRNA-ribosyltransferase
MTDAPDRSAPLTTLDLPRGSWPLPIFLPDATRGVVRAVDSADLEAVGVEGLVMSTFHLMQSPGSSTIQALGGLGALAGWRGPIISDSGGFQIYSLARQNPKYGSISEKGMVYRADNGEKYNLTPEKSIQLQMSYGADVLYCLDDPTHVDESEAAQEESVRRTIKWAKICRREYDTLLKGKKWGEAERPRLFGVVQGGGLPELRRGCAEALLEIGFDGYGYGGWPLDADNKLLSEMFALVRALIPPGYPLHALGVGHPANVVECARLGYTIFDSAMPTRDARNGRLYRFTRAINTDPLHESGDWFEYLYIEDKRHIKAPAPISDHCDCPACARYSLAYLHHLYAINDGLYLRLATLHNLRFMTQLMGRLRALLG